MSPCPSLFLALACSRRLTGEQITNWGPMFTLRNARGSMQWSPATAAFNDVDQSDLIHYFESAPERRSESGESRSKRTYNVRASLPRMRTFGEGQTHEVAIVSNRTTEGLRCYSNNISSFVWPLLHLSKHNNIEPRV